MTIETAQPDRTAGGSEIASIEHPEDGLAIQDVTNGDPEHEVGVSGGLPWYVASKFEWRNNKTGPGRHLAPHESYIADVIREGLGQQDKFKPTGKKLSSEQDLALTEAATLRSLIETRNEFDVDDDDAAQVKMEAKCILRDLRTRYLLALKIAGSTHVDRMYRIRHFQLNDWNVEQLLNSERFIASANTRDKWARKAFYYNCVIENLASEFTAAGIELNIEGGIRQSLFSDGRDEKARLATPAKPVTAADTADKADLSAMAA